MNSKPLLMLLTVAVATASALFFHPMEEAVAEKQTAGTTEDYAENASTSNQRLMELPARLKGVPEQIIRHTGFTLSFNREHNNPNWVAWELTASEASAAGRREDNFLPDPEVAAPHQVTTADYKGSGYDRGHMVPAADMHWSGRAQAECFYMTNICPQDHSLNAGSWATLEKACRRWAQQEGRVYIVCGPLYDRGRKLPTIGRDHRVTVPTGFFKCVLSLQQGREKAIGFIYSNRSHKQPMTQATTSVDEVERLTGMDFFVNVPDQLERRIEASYSLKVWR